MNVNIFNFFKCNTLLHILYFVVDSDMHGAYQDDDDGAGNNIEIFKFIWHNYHLTICNTAQVLWFTLLGIEEKNPTQHKTSQTYHTFISRNKFNSRLT